MRSLAWLPNGPSSSEEGHVHAERPLGGPIPKADAVTAGIYGTGKTRRPAKDHPSLPHLAVQVDIVEDEETSPIQVGHNTVEIAQCRLFIVMTVDVSEVDATAKVRQRLIKAIIEQSMDDSGVDPSAETTS
jgi:hypothetical protein